MIYYILILLADCFLAISFLAQKKYQNRCGATIISSLRFPILSGIFSGMVFLLAVGFAPKLTGFSLAMAAMQTICTTAYTLIGFLILKNGTLALYTIFLMTGGMILPYIFGILFLKEAMTIWRTLGLIVITASLVFMNFKKGMSNYAQLPLCTAVFILNGFVSIISKIHQITPESAVSSNDFVFLTSIMKVIICLPLYLLLNKNKKETLFNHADIPMLAIVALAAVASAVNYLFQLVSASELPASVLYPMVTGGNIILTAIAGRIVLKEKLSGVQKAAIGLCAVGTCMFL